MSKAAKDSIAARLRALSASIIADALEGRGAVVDPGLRRFSGKGVIAGQAVTADCAPGSLMAVFPAVDQAKPGDVLCIIAPGNTAYLGDLLATDLAERKLSAAIVDGHVRDVTTLASLPVSIFARGSSPIARRGNEPGQAMTSIAFGGVNIEPGNWIVADDDGVVVITGDVMAVLEKAEELAAIEQRIMDRIRAGAKVRDAVSAELGKK